MDTERLVEHVDGTGTLSGRDLDVVVQYGVTVRRRYLDSGLGSEIPGRLSISAHAVFEPTAWSALHRAFDAGDQLLLTLEDGRKLPCFIRDMPIAGDTLLLVAKGGFE